MIAVQYKHPSGPIVQPKGEFKQCLSYCLYSFKLWNQDSTYSERAPPIIDLFSVFSHTSAWVGPAGLPLHRYWFSVNGLKLGWWISLQYCAVSMQAFAVDRQTFRKLWLITLKKQAPFYINLSLNITNYEIINS